MQYNDCTCTRGVCCTTDQSIGYLEYEWFAFAEKVILTVDENKVSHQTSFHIAQSS